MPGAQPVVTPSGASERTFVGAVLCGGSSRRMGRDKALLPVAGRPLALAAIGALQRAGAVEVLLVGGAVEPLAAPGVRFVADLHPGEGPLGGIVTALAAAAASDRSDAPVVVLTCDLPWIGAEEVGAILEALASTPDAPCAAPLVEGRPQFLTAAYRSSAHAPLAAAFDKGERAVRRAMSALSWVGFDGLDPGRLRDADTPDDLPPESVRTGQWGEH